MRPQVQEGREENARHQHVQQGVQQTTVLSTSLCTRMTRGDDVYRREAGQSKWWWRVLTLI